MGVVVAAVTLGAALTAVASAQAVKVVHLPASTKPEGPAVSTRGGRLITTVLPYKQPYNHGQGPTSIPAGTTIPTTLYNTVAGQDGNTYDFSIVGGNFTATGTGVTTVPLDIIPLTITFSPTGDVYDPTTANSSCSEPVSPLTAIETGPALVPRRWYAGHTFVGYGQYLNALQRGEFWAWANPKGVSPGYGLNVSVSNPEDATYTVNAPEQNPGKCNNLGEIDMATFDAAIQAFLNTWSSTSIPLIVIKNVVLTNPGQPGFYVAGYHSAFTDSSGNTQTYAVSTYLTPDVVALGFPWAKDLAIISHEIGEWANNPFTTNSTPAWGHLGQVSGCQSNLEVGDPLTGTEFTVAPTRPGGGPTYNLQELVFAGWFYDQNWGVNGWYSTRGAFTSGAALCS